MAISKKKTSGLENPSFVTTSKFLGYRNREDITKLPSGYTVVGSQNVLIDISGRLKSRMGYTLDGQSNTTMTPILSAFDWEEHKGSVIHLRNPAGSLQYRYVDALGVVTWRDLKTSLTATQPLRYTNYWDNTELINVVLFVDGTSNVYEWNGGIATFASATANTITKQGSETWGQLGFYTAANKKIVLGGIEYTYTGGEGTTTLTGVTPDPTLGGHSVGDVINQQVVTTANSSITNLPSSLSNDFISNLQNQIYIGSQDNNNVYLSQQNNYKSFAYTSPVRLVGEGAIVTLRDNVMGFVPQEEYMYVSAGKSQWYQTQKTLSSDNAAEFFTILPLKSASNQGTMSQELTAKDKNNVIFVSNEPVLTSLGRVSGVIDTPQLGDYSYPIVNDFNNYDFSDGSVKYFKNYVYVAVPQEGKYLVLNQTDPNNVFWEAPQTGPFSCFSIIDGEIYAHGYNVPETYKLFSGYTDNGAPILSRAAFPFLDYGSKADSKQFNEYFIDGYINANTNLTCKWNLDIDGCATTVTKTLNGANKNVVCLLPSDASLGKTSLGKHGLGTDSIVQGGDPLPPYFNVIFTNIPKDFYHVQFGFESYGADYRWELLSFGPALKESSYGNNAIKI